MTEEWKDIQGYEGKYEVSNLGRVRSLDHMMHRFDSRMGIEISYIVKGRILRQARSIDGYPIINLNTGGRGTGHTHRIHALVARAFIPNPGNLPEVNHKDEDKTNNRADNLEWCTGLYNIRYGTGIERRTKALYKAVAQIDADGNIVATYESISAAAEATGYTRSAIGKCCKGNPRHKTAGGYRWKYKQ